MGSRYGSWPSPLLRLHILGSIETMLDSRRVVCQLQVLDSLFHSIPPVKVSTVFRTKLVHEFNFLVLSSKGSLDGEIHRCFPIGSPGIIRSV